jgi:predicted nucleic-acid-binding Zn-ribbon protein
MLTCPSCGTTNLKGSTITEADLVTHFTLKSNPRTSDPSIVPKWYDNENVTYVLLCVKCGAENQIEDAPFKIVKK